MRDFIRWMKRLRFDIAAGIVVGIGLIYVGISMGNFEKILYKIFMFNAGALFIHLHRQFLFPDLGLWRLLTNKIPELQDERARAIVMAALLLTYAILMHGFLGGI